MKKLPMVVVEWEDIAAHSSWYLESEVKEECKPLLSRTIGWRMASDRKVMRVASTRCESGKCSDVVAIPRGCIKSIRRVE